MKLLREKYKTFDGAYKRCRFENGIAAGEYRRGDKARHYHYSVVQEKDYYTGAAIWRVQRDNGRME